jgi:carboxyl-terminal processing protease
MLKKIWLSIALSCFCTSFSLWADPAPSASPGKKSSLPIDDLRLFSEVFHQIKSTYVNEVSDQQLIEYAIQGMLNNLDPHSAYLNKADFADLKESASGEFAGIGIEITTENGFMKVVSPIDDTPASRAGIQAGDIIVKINNTVIKSLSADEGTNLMRGEKGSPVTITIARENENKPIELTLVRDIIKVKSVKTEILEKQWGYIRISQFQEQTGAEAKQQLQKMLNDSYNQLQGLIIDLRNNPGGILGSAIDVADLFLTNGLIVYTKGKNKESQESYNATPESFMKDKPIIVLINAGSASASEIVAGALQDQKRALIAGTTSFGKGSVQIILELPNDRGMKLTTARYYTPSGRSIQAEGIKPDIEIENASLTKTPDDNLTIKEANLTKHLENTNTVKQADNPKPKALNLDDDYQLHETLNLLKAMSLARSTIK